MFCKKFLLIVDCTHFNSLPIPIKYTHLPLIFLKSFLYEDYIEYNMADEDIHYYDKYIRVLGLA